MGNPIEMYCTLNQSHPLGVGYTSQNLSFVVDSNENYWPVERINNTAIRLYVEEATVSPDNHYVVTCRLGEKGICTRHVYVGYKPAEVTDFQCISYNWERLECTWNAQPNPIQTIYTLSYASSIMSRRTVRHTCPTSSSNATTCILKQPTYKPTHTFNFTMTVSNALAKLTQPLGVLDHYAVGKTSHHRFILKNANAKEIT